jgi:hypothetical protein
MRLKKHFFLSGAVDTHLHNAGKNIIFVFICVNFALDLMHNLKKKLKMLLFQQCRNEKSSLLISLLSCFLFYVIKISMSVCFKFHFPLPATVSYSAPSSQQIMSIISSL